MTDVLGALADEGAAFERALQGVAASEFERVTNCPPWTLSELVVHVAASIRIGEFAPAASDAVLREPADYYRRPERSTETYRQSNVQQAQELAIDLQTPSLACGYFSYRLQQTLAQLVRLDLDRPVHIHRVGAMRLRDWLISRVISVAAHGLDVAITLRCTAWTTATAHDVMRPTFVSLLGREPPADLAWDDQHFFELATGRCQLTGTERTQLGSQAARFPLLS